MANNKTILVSDVHLDPRAHERQVKFQKFLETVLPETDRLIILGDLFEFWFGYNSVIFHDYFPILVLLWKFRQEGKKIQYVTGNHDFHMGAFMKETLGLEISESGIDLQVNGKLLYLCHGDCINSRDHGYKILHRITRNTVTIKLFSLIPPHIGLSLALKLSNASRSYTKNRDVVPRQSILDFFHEKLDQGYDGLIYGHTHTPEYTESNWNEKKVLLINSGDWIEHSSYLEIENGNITLREFS